MSAVKDNEVLNVPLFHGTSSLFLQSIVRFGLGGRNPIDDWKVLEFARAIYPLVEENFAFRGDFMLKWQSFRFMVEQKSAAMNFQHGQTYLSVCESTAIRYAANNRYGSELLTYTLEFLSELVRLNVAGVSDRLYEAYPQIFRNLDSSPAPLLVRVDRIPTAALLAEDGKDAAPLIARVRQTMASDPGLSRISLQRTNFRLVIPVPIDSLKLWLIDIRRFDQLAPEYSLYPISATPEPNSIAGISVLSRNVRRAA